MTPPAPAKPTSFLAIALYLQGDLNEIQLARKLGLDRLETRSRVAEFLNTAIANAGVPVERVGILETRLATALSQLLAEQVKTHDLRNEIQLLTLQTEELQLELDAARRDLAAERQHLAELARAAGEHEGQSDRREQGGGGAGEKPERSAPMK